MALLYTTNAILKHVVEPDWRFYFFLCLFCYSELYNIYIFPKVAIESLFALALDCHAISTKEVRSVLDLVLDRTKSDAFSANEVSAYIADLDLAIQNPAAATTAVLAERLNEITLFDEFMEGILQEENV